MYQSYEGSAPASVNDRRDSVRDSQRSEMPSQRSPINKTRGFASKIQTPKIRKNGRYSVDQTMSNEAPSPRVTEHNRSHFGAASLSLERVIELQEQTIQKMQDEMSLLKEENKQLTQLKDKLLQKIEDLEGKELIDASVDLKLQQWQAGIEELCEQTNKKSTKEGFQLKLEMRKLMKSIQQFTFKEMQRIKTRYVEMMQK